MTQYVFLFWLLFVFFFPHGSFSKSLTNTDFTFDSGNSNAKTDVDQTGNEDAALHEMSYRPRHKYKSENGHQSRFYRSETDGDKEQDVKVPQCAVMYKNNEPVGILQPFEDSYRFLQVSGEPTFVDINPIPVKRKTIMDVLYPSKMVDDYDTEVVDNSVAQFTDEKYPSIFAKFRIDSRLDKAVNPDFHLKRSMHKRGSDKVSIHEEQVAKSAMSKVKSDNSAAVEEELKDILDDMGLIDDYSDNKDEVKREAEDENLELGTNKISLVKEEHKEKRDKRQDQSISSTTTAAATTALISKKSILPINTAGMSQVVKVEEKHDEESENVALLDSNEKVKLHEESENIDVSTEKEVEEEELRKKRENKNDKKDIKRDASLSNVMDFTTSGLVKEEELSAYEKRVEREIRDKIEKLKNEVKKEISELKQTDTGKNKKEGFSEDTKRRKRQVVNTLLDEESVDINPILNADGKSENHIRRKRHTSLQEEASNSPMKSNDLGNIGLQNIPIIEEKSRELHDIRQLSSKGKCDIATNNKGTEFIGINPVLENGNHTKYHLRALKQYAEDKNAMEGENKAHIRVKRQISDQKNEEKNESEDKKNIRRKRETKDELQDDVYQDDDSEFNDDITYDNSPISNQQNVNTNTDSGPLQLTDRLENNQISSANGCKCDKNSNECKCGSPTADLNIPSFQQGDSSDLTGTANLLEKKSVNTHCACGKNDNHCKCGHIVDDVPYKQENYAAHQENNIVKKSVNEKDASNEIEGNSLKANMPRRIRDRNAVEKVAYLPNEEKNHLTEEKTKNDESDESNFVKRDARSRKFLLNQPFRNGEYFVDLHPDIYRLSLADNSREKRENFDELIAMHGGNSVKKNLVTIKERSVIPHFRFRRRVQSDDDKQPRQLIDMSDEDLFGALPQSYAGELARYKRVKRTKTKK